jgi:radical SAM superfamily enzyme YgiQ (UPF0313 family)
MSAERLPPTPPLKVLFIYSIESGPSLHEPLHDFGQMQFGISYISAVLKRAGIDTRLLVLSSELERDSMALAEETICGFDPEVIAFTCVSTQFPMMDRLARLAKQRWPKKYLVIGGAHVSLNPEEAATSVFDAVCVAEGEYALLELCEELQAGRQPEGIGNLWLKGLDGALQRNAPRPFLEDLDELPFPDHEMWMPWINHTVPHYPNILLGRGCPYLCTYCCNHALRRLAPGKYVRFRSPANVVSEIRHVLEKYACDAPLLFLEVETIGVFRDWTLELCAALQEFNRSLAKPIRFQTNFRITSKTLDAEIFKALAAANFGLLNIGLEAGSERVRREVLKRNYTNEEFYRAVRLARDHGIEVNLFNMIGLPGETLADHLETVKLNHDTHPNRSFTSIFFPYPGTDLHRICKERGLLQKPLSVNKERRKAALDLPEFPRRSVQRAYDLFEWRIHEGQWPRHVRLRRLISHYIGKSPAADRVVTALLPVWKRLSGFGPLKRSKGKRVDTC